MEHGGDIYSDTIEYDFSVNLNPLDCKAVIHEIMEESHTKAGQYPDPLQRGFREAVAQMEGACPEEVIGGNGASELLLTLVTMIQPKRALLLTPCFSGYRHALSTLPECEIVEYALEEEKGFSLGQSFVEALDREAKLGLDVLFLTNPNNPTGKTVPAEILDRVFHICKENGIAFLVDECFLRMSEGSQSMVPYIGRYDRLFIISAFTKLFSIPGIRVGYVVSNRENIVRISRLLPEWNLSSIAQEAGRICSRYVRGQHWEKRTLDVIIKEREYLSEGLRDLGFQVFDSDTSFVLLYAEKDLYAILKRDKILIRDCGNFKGLGKGFYRIAVKGHQENELLLARLRMRMDEWN